MSTEQKNEVIAKWIGIKQDGATWLIPVMQGSINARCEPSIAPPKYNQDWNCLMPVVEKIMDTEIPNGRYGSYPEFSITNYDSIFWTEGIPGDQNQPQSYPMGGSRISRVFESVYQFIEWYNSNVKEK